MFSSTAVRISDLVKRTNSHAVQWNEALCLDVCDLPPYGAASDMFSKHRMALIRWGVRGCPVGCRLSMRCNFPTYAQYKVPFCVSHITRRVLLWILPNLTVCRVPSLVAVQKLRACIALWAWCALRFDFIFNSHQTPCPLTKFGCGCQ
jgi:hypothetical protein